MSDAAGKARDWSPLQPARLADAQPAPVDTGVEREQARKSGYDAGFAEGLAAARTQSQALTAQLSALLDAMADPFQDSDAVLLRELLDLTERVCRAVIGRELSTHADIEGVLREALAALGASSVTVELTLHPADAALCREQGILPDDRYHVVETGTMERGGCQLRAGARFVDASVEARIDAALDALRDAAGVPLDDLPPEAGAPRVASADDPVPE